MGLEGGIQTRRHSSVEDFWDSSAPPLGLALEIVHIRRKLAALRYIVGSWVVSRRTLLAGS